MDKVRVRFAPSPTGFLHIGSLRQVIFNYLIAKKYGGTFILRIEDTDRKRLVEGSAERLMEITEWCGLHFDEGPNIGGDYGPYVQSERRDIYDKYAAELLAKGGAYHCFCTEERLAQMKAELEKNKMPPRYDRACRNLSAEEIAEKLKNNEPYVIRQAMPLDGEIKITDEIHGEITFKATSLDDHVLIKTDGMPTYQFASVVDDHLMEISHVVRGDEWISSFPKNILLYQAFGWQPPKFIHLPLTLNKEGGKLSKRQGDVSVEDFRGKGYLAEALINFSALLGWHPKDDNELLSLDDIIAKFEIKDIGISPAVFDIDKLDFFNGHYIRLKNLDELTRLCLPYLLKASMVEEAQGGYRIPGLDKVVEKKYIETIVGLAQERMKKLSEVNELSDFFFNKIDYPADMLVWKKSNPSDTKIALTKIYELLEKVPEAEWVRHAIKDVIMTYLAAKELKTGDYLWPMRVALTGRQASPGPFEVAEALGKEESLKRIKDAVDKL